MNKIGVFICNYNGRDYVLNCLRSLYQQSLQQFDAYVVDNASTDGSVDAVTAEYGTKVTVLQNSENLGGAGGFDRGLHVGLDKGYPYIVLLDNDILLDAHLLENMQDYLDQHSDVGIVGSKVMIMDMPEQIQDYGDYLDFDIFREKNAYCMQKDGEHLPSVNECDYVPTCAVMIRSEVMKKSGTMPADNFIYYDDIELSHKMTRMGYKIVALGNAKVWHKGGFRKAAVNTFSQYYFLRNRLHFFAKYVKDTDIEKFADSILSETFSRLYGFRNKGMEENFKTAFFAFDDFLHNVRGKAADYKILNIQKRETPFERLVAGKNRIHIIFMDNFNRKDPLDIFHIFLYIVTVICKKEAQEEITVSLGECGFTQEEFEQKLQKVIDMDMPDFVMPVIRVTGEAESCDLKLKLCEHVRLTKESILPVVYVDRYCNCIADEEDHQYFASLSSNEKFFCELYRPLLMETIRKIREAI